MGPQLIFVERTKDPKTLYACMYTDNRVVESEAGVGVGEEKGYM